MLKKALTKVGTMLDRDLAFMRLVKASWTRSLGAEAEAILSEAEAVERSLVAFTLANLCGVSVPEGPGFGARLEAALAGAGPGERVVTAFASPGACLNGACRDKAGVAPCEAACPFHALINGPGGIAIDTTACVDCGRCVGACPEGLLQDKVEYLPATQLMKGGRPVIAAVAPAIAGQFGEGASIERLRTAFKLLGYADMVEVAFFADMLTMKEAGEFDEHILHKDDFLISSCCCPMWVAMLRKVYAGLVRHVSPSVSPMIAAGRVLKILRPDCAVVFVGPCIAKKSEAKEADLLGAIDHVFTFQEIRDVFQAAGIEPSRLEGQPSTEYASRGGRLYARAGGVSIAVAEAVAELYPDKALYFKAHTADGVPACKALLEGLAKGEKDKEGATFMEGMGCVGGCVGGPKAVIPRDQGKAAVDAQALASQIAVATRSDCMKEILGQLGIFGPDAFTESGRGGIFERSFGSPAPKT